MARLLKFSLRLQSLVLLVLVPGLLVTTAIFGWSTYRSVYDLIMTGFDQKLFAVATVTGAFIRGEDHEAVFAAGNEDDPLYRRYAAPMTRIMERKGITYLYTERVDMGGRLTYVIDGTEGEDHSDIGTEEEIADDEIPAMERAMLQGLVRLSDIEDWGAWGLLKTADAPIYRDDGTVAALAAADIDISVILEKTRVALVKVGFVAALMLVLGAIVSLFISRRLVAPLSDVKEGALQLAAGRYGHRIPDQALLELRDLSTSFNNMSGALADTIEELTKTNLALENVRRRRALEIALADPIYQPDPGLPFVVERAQPADGEAHSPSGFVHVKGPKGDRVLVWIAEPIPENPLENLRLRNETAAIAKPILAQHHDNWEAVAEFLSRLLPRVQALVLFDAGESAVRARARVPTMMAVVSPDGLVREVDLSVTPMCEVGPTEWVVVAEVEALTAAEVLRRERLARPAGAGADYGGPGKGTRRRPRFPYLAVSLLGRELAAVVEPKPTELPLPLPALMGS